MNYDSAVVILSEPPTDWRNSLDSEVQLVFFILSQKHLGGFLLFFSLLVSVGCTLASSRVA